MAGDQTTLARARIAKDSEEQVLAEGALQGEKLVARARLAMMVLAGLFQIVGRFFEREGEGDHITGLVVVLYSLWSVAILVKIPRTAPRSQTTRWGYLLTTVDVAFFCFMGQRHVNGATSEALVITATLTLPIIFSISRNSLAQVALATATSLGSWLWLMWLLVQHRGGGQVDAKTISLVSAVYLSMGVLVGLTATRARRLFSNLRKRDNLTRFLAPQVVEQVMRFGEAALAPTQREVTLLFSDIRDFTTLSETMEPRAVLALLDDYFGEMTRIVMGCEGSVNKLIGDGLLAVWGVPDRTSDHAALAVKAALAMRARLIELNAMRTAQGKAPLRIGIGVHTGRVAAGMLGGAEQHEYTVIGDAVNLCSRIEGLNKEQGTDILVSEATWKLLGERYVGALCCESAVKGRAKPVRVYTLEGLRPGPASALSSSEADLPLPSPA